MKTSFPLPAEPIEVNVQSQGGLGDGIATWNSKPLFIAKACPGDRLEVRIIHQNHDGYYGTITRLLQPGPLRQMPPCSYFDHCGGCTLQQLIPQAYRDFKTRMLNSALAKAGFSLPAELLFIPPHSRRRVEFKVKHEKGEILLSLLGLNSHTPIAINHCLLLRPELEALIAPLNQALSAWPMAPHIHAVGLTLADSGIDLLLTLKNVDINNLPSLDYLLETVPLARICIRTTETPPIVIAEISPVEMSLGNYAVALPADAFLQATAEGQQLLTDFCMKAVQGASSVIDLFCGIGTYSFPMSRYANVHAVEGSATMIAALQAGINRHAISHLTCEQRDLFKSPLEAKALARFDAAIINPPRIGAKAQVEQLAHSPLSTIAMVSCNPATFARDAKILAKAGFTSAKTIGIDQFVWSQHLEIAGVFTR